MRQANIFDLLVAWMVHRKSIPINSNGKTIDCEKWALAMQSTGSLKAAAMFAFMVVKMTT